MSICRLPGRGQKFEIAIRYHGCIVVGASGGRLSFQWAQNTSNAAATIVRKGSTMRVWTSRP